MPNIPSLLFIQWGIIGLYATMYFILGFLRGAQKSIYFTLVNIITTIVTIVIISQVSITFIFNFIDQQSFLNLINDTSGGFLTDYMVYLSDPTILATIFVFVDLVLRIVFFVLFFPIIKGLLSLIIFRPIWKFAIKKAIIKKQNAELEADANEKGIAFKPKKKIRKGISSRFVGGISGAVNGLIMAFIVLIPLTVMASYISDIDNAALASIESDSTEVATSIIPGFEIPSQVIDYLNQIKEMDQNGLASITRQITIGGTPIDQYIFDEMFTVTATVNDTPKDVNFINELENILGISTVIINGGYLDPDFDYTQISTANLNDLEAIFGYIGNSDVLGFLIPTAVKYGVDTFLVDQYGIDFTNRVQAQAALDMFYNIDWNDEFARLYALVESVLQFGSVQEILDMMADPTLLLTLTPEQGVALANIIRSAGDLEVLSLINVGIDYLTTLESVQNQLGWLETSAEKEAYLQDKLSFILDNPDFFVGDQGEISNIAQLIELVFSDAYGDTNLEEIVNSAGDLSQVLELQNADWVSALFSQLTQLQLLLNAIPIGADIGLNSAGGDLIDETLAQEFETMLADIDFADEITNIDHIYQSIVKLGLEQIFVDNPDYFAYADFLLENNMDDVRDIVSYIFTDSQLVNQSLELVAPVLIESLIADDQTKEIVSLLTINADGEFDFNVGQELISILNILEYTHDYATINSLVNFTNLTTEEQLDIFVSLGAMPTEDYDAYITAFNDLQLLNRINEETAPSLVTLLNLEDSFYVPTSFSLNNDVTSLINMLRDVGLYLSVNQLEGMNYEDVDLTNLLQTISDDLTDPDKRSDLLFYNMAFLAKKYSEDGSLSSFLSVPQVLINANVEDQPWEDEISALLNSVFDIFEALGNTDGLKLSVKDMLLAFSDIGTLPIEVLTQFSDLNTAQDAFGSLDSSIILRASIAKMIDSQGETMTDALLGHVVSTPDQLQTDGVLNTGIFVNFIQGFSTFVSGMNETLGFEMIGDFAFDDLTLYFSAYNQMDNADIHAFVESTLLRAIISDMFTDEVFQASLVDTLNTFQDIFVVPSDFFTVDPQLLDGPVLVSGEITNIFQMIKALNLESMDFSGIGLQTFTNLVVADPVTHEDNFDEFFASNYIYSIFDKILRLDSISSYVATLLGDSLGANFDTLDLSIPQAMLGQSADVTLGNITSFEENRIPKAEFRRMLTSLNTLGDLETIGLETFTQMINPATANDDFSTFIDSDFIYLVLSRLIGNQGFANYAEEAMSGAFGNDPIALDMSVPTDATGSTGIEVGFISRYELRNLMVSFKLLGFGGDSQIDVATIISMPSLNTYSQTFDDLDIFLRSIYLTDKMSQMLLSSTIIDLIGAGQFTSNDFDLPSNAYNVVVPTRLATNQIHLLFDSLILLGIGDFNNLDIGISTVTNLSTADQTALLDSLYLYEVIDLMIKSQEAVNPGDTGLTIPVDAYVTGGYYDQMISRTEILAVLSVFDIPEIGTDPQAIDTNTITTATLLSVLNKDSRIINQMISDQIETAISIEHSTIAEAYVQTPNVDRILNTEMKALVEVMNVIGVTKLSDPISVTDVSVALLQDIHYLGLGTNPLGDQYDSYIIHNMISEQLETNLSVNFTTTPEAYTNATGYNRIKADEVQALILAMTEMGISNLSGSFSADDLLVAQLQAVHYLGLGVDPSGDDYQSYLINHLLSDGIIGALPSIPSTVYLSNGDLFASEIQDIIDAVSILSNDPNASLTTMSFANDQLTPTVVETLLNLDSMIINRQISNGIISANLAVDEAYANALDTNYDPQYLLINGDGDIKVLEMYALVAAMTEMGITNLSGSFDPNSITVDKLQNLHYIGLGTDPLLDTYDSYIVHHMISDGITTTLTNMPSTVFMTNGDLLASEVQGVISAVGILNTNPNASLGAIDFANGGLTPSKISDLLDLNSLIIDRQISEGIISAHLDVSESYAQILDINFDPLYGTGDLKVSEMYALVEAMNIMGITDLSGTFAANAITIEKLQLLHYVGLGVDPVLDTYNSYIVHNMLSDAMDNALDVPTGGYMIGGYMSGAEVQGIIDALNIISSDPNDTLSDIMPINDNSIFTATTLESLLDIGTLTVYRLVAKGIIDSGVATLESLAVSGDANYDSNAIGSDVKVSEMYGLVESMNILGIADVTQVSNISYASVMGLTDAEVDQILDNTNTITFFIIDDVVDPFDNFFAPDYFTDLALNTRVLRTTLITYIKANN